MADNIAQYTSPVDKITPSETGAETLARMGRVEKENYDEAGRSYGSTLKDIGSSVDNFEYLQEVSQGSAALAVMHNNLAATWNTLSSQTNPNDTSIQQKYMDDANSQLEKWQSSFGTKRGQDWALNQADSMRTHLWDRTSADMTSRAGSAAVKNLTTTLTNLSEVAHKDPTSLDQLLGQTDAIISAAKENSNGVLRPEQVDKLGGIGDDMKNEIVKSAFKGMSDNNPAAAKATLASGKFDRYLTDDDKDKINGYADAIAHGKQVDAARSQTMKTLQTQQANVKANNSYLSSLNQGGIPLASEVISNPALTTQQKSMWVSKNGILNMPADKLHDPTYGQNFSQAVQAVYSGQGYTPDGLLQGIRKGEISPQGAQQLSNMSAAMKTPEGIAQLNAQKQVLDDVRAQVIKGGGVVSDPVGQKNYNAFLQSFYQHWDTAINKGVSVSELTDPKNSNYIGNLAQGFKRNDAQAISDVMSAAKSPPAPTAPKATAVKKWAIKNGALVEDSGQ